MRESSSAKSVSKPLNVSPKGIAPKRSLSSVRINVASTFVSPFTILIISLIEKSQLHKATKILLGTTPSSVEINLPVAGSNPRANVNTSPSSTAFKVSVSLSLVTPSSSDKSSPNVKSNNAAKEPVATLSSAILQVPFSCFKRFNTSPKGMSFITSLRLYGWFSSRPAITCHNLRFNIVLRPSSTRVPSK